MDGQHLDEPSWILEGRGWTGIKLEKSGAWQTVLVSLEPSLKKVEDLIKWHPEVIKFLEKDLKVELEGWAASKMVVRSLGQRISMELVAEFRLHVGLKGRWPALVWRWDSPSSTSRRPERGIWCSTGHGSSQTRH